MAGAMLSEHFAQSEFEKDCELEDDLVPIFQRMCLEILELMREFAACQSWEVTSGYRPEQANAEAHGQPSSEHIATPRKCASDGLPINGKSVREVFDWARNNTLLPFHQLILEHGANGSSVIHVSINEDMPGVRSVLEGATHNAEPYVKIDHVAYNPPSNAGAVQDAAAEG